jgi:hypothetical protein
MAVLVEGISVIVRRDTVDAQYPGGWEAYVKDVPNKTLCSDERLARVGFMTSYGVDRFVARLERLGFEFIRDARAVDVCIVDQHQGPTARCDWLEYFYLEMFGSTNRVAVCRAVKDSRDEFAVPDGWNFEHSLTRNHNVVRNEEMAERLELIQHENGVSAYRDRTTGPEVYMERTTT